MTFLISKLLKNCTTLTHVEQVHAQIVRTGLDQDHALISQFICLCQTLSALSYSTSVFDSVVSPNTCLWNVLVKGCCEKSRFDDAVSVFVRMKREEGLADGFTYPLLIKACASEARVREGMAFHGSAMRCGVDGDVFVRTSLIDFYGKCGEVRWARKLFDEMSLKNVVSWTAMVVGYVVSGDLAKAENLFAAMPQRNAAAWNVMINGFVKAGNLSGARSVFEAMLEKNAVSFTTMIDGYAKAGDMASARVLFDRAPVRDVFAWSALISGYAQSGQLAEAMSVFREMRRSGVQPDEYVLVSLMSACSQLGNPVLAKWVDNYVAKSSIDLSRPHVIAALIDMNAKCGNLERAKSLFETTPKHDLITYCSMMQSLSVHGRGKEAVSLFNQMRNKSLPLDGVAFTVILTACSRAGLVEEGLRIFESLKNNHSFGPSPNHYACAVDILARSGRLEEAHELLNSMPLGPHESAWGALLAACKQHGNTELGELVAARLLEIQPQNSGNYVLLSQIYAEKELWNDVSLVRDRMKEKGVRKLTARSWLSY